MFMQKRTRASLAAAVTALAAAATLLAATGAGAQAAVTAESGWKVQDYATGFPGVGIGPIGIAAQGDEMWIGSYFDGHLYRFGPGGGTVSAATRVSSAPIEPQLAGLAFAKDGRLYAALQRSGRVVELARRDGHVVRVVANIATATGIATDPVSGDLFVSHPGGGVARLRGFASGPATVTQYTSALGRDVDGIAFAPDGTMFAAAGNAVLRIVGTDGPNPGTATIVADVPNADGIAVSTNAGSDRAAFALVNRVDGVITKVDLTTTPATTTNIVTGGSRGDFVGVGGDGCFYATQSDRVIKVTRSDGSCDLVPLPCSAAPLRQEIRNPAFPADTRCETQLIGGVRASAEKLGGYTSRQSNVATGADAGGAAIHGCRSEGAGTAAGSEPCLRANNLATGLAFEFNSMFGASGGRITVGPDPSALNASASPFTTNATGVATGLNADRVDGKDASELGPGDVRVAAQGATPIAIPTCSGTSLATCPSLVTRTLAAGNWLVQAKLVVANAGDASARTMNRCGLTQGAVELDRARNSLARKGASADGESEAVSLMAVVSGATPTVTVGLRCTEQAGEELQVEDAKITAVKVAGVVAGA